VPLSAREKEGRPAYKAANTFVPKLASNFDIFYWRSKKIYPASSGHHRELTVIRYEGGSLCLPGKNPSTCDNFKLMNQHGFSLGDG
jgi:hypothetical protein